MSLRIRRGTDAQRQTITLDQGEIAFTTDTKKIYVGDGVTLGGNNILATSGGVGVTFNATTQALDFNTGALGLTTSAVIEGANKYFTVQRAQDAAASLFTSSGSPPVSGTITNTVATGTVVLGSTPSVMVQGERFVVTGNAFATGNLLNGTYYVVSQNGGNVVLASTFALAQAGTAITTLTTATLTGVTYTASGTDSGITFTYDSVNHTIIATASGSNATSLVTDLAPQLGANLALNSYAISGNGSIGITGNITNTGNINNTGTITSNGVANLGGLTTTGTVSASIITASGAITGQTLVATQGLGANLPLNGKTISGSGNIGITGGLTLNLTADIQTRQSLDVVGTTGYITSLVSRGTLVVPTAIRASDELGGILVRAYTNGSKTGIAGIVSFIVDDTAVIAGGDYVKSKLVLSAATDTSQDAGNAFILSSDGTVTSNAFVASKYTQLAVYANDAARSTAIPAPAKGMMVFMTAGTVPSVTNKAVIYNGTAWALMPG
jgi:hypothetical protein